MIILPEREIVIITPPKTGSNYLHHAITEKFWVYGQTGEHVTQHSTIVPEQFKDFDFYVSARNPYYRLFSIFRHYVCYHKYSRNYLDWIFDRGILPGWFERPIHWYRDNTRTNVTGKELNFCGYLKLECINDHLEFLDIPFNKEVGRHSLGNKPALEEIAYPIVERLYKQDFERCNYAYYR